VRRSGILLSSALASLVCLAGALLGGKASPARAQAYSWAAVPVASSAGFTGSVACTGPARCYVGFDSASGGNLEFTLDGGGTWQASGVAFPSPLIEGLYCVDALRCLAVGSDASATHALVLYSSDGGAVYRPVLNFDYSIAALLASLLSVSCNGSSCVAVGYYIDANNAGHPIEFVSANPGGPWQPVSTFPANVGLLVGVDCVGGSVCIAVGTTPAQDQGLVLVSSNNGASWSETLATTAATYMDSIACSSQSACLVGGDTFSGGSYSAALFSSSNGGASWTQLPPPPGVGIPESIGCPSSVCFVGGTDPAGTNAVLVELSSSGYQAQTVPSGLTDLASASCISAAANACYFLAFSATGGESLVTNAGSQGVPVVTGLSVSFGPVAGGQVVEIQGLSFGTVTSVAFGATPSPSVTQVSPTVVSAVAPPAAGPGPADVTVTNATGTSATAPVDVYTYLASSAYQPLAPTRICDTRVGPSVPPNQCNSSGAAAGTLAEGGSLGVTVAGQSGVPAGAVAVVLNVTVTNTTDAGYLTIYPSGSALPIASSMNWHPGETRANLVTVTLGASGAISVFNGIGSTDVILDLEGYYASGGSLFNPSSPSRICDTRTSGNQCSGQTLGPGSTLTFNVSATGVVPASGVTAVVLNVTATDTTAAGGYLTIWPAGQSRPLASNLNFGPGQTEANRVIVAVGTGGTVSVYNFMGTTDVVVDVDGWYSSTGYQYNPLSPTRICDTRLGASQNQCSGQTLGPGSTIQVRVGQVAGVPSSAHAAGIVATATDTTAWSYYTIWPTGQPQPLASDLNWSAGATVANLDLVALGSGGSVSVFNSAGQADLVVDVTGWF
jgi:hypothetical protein